MFFEQRLLYKARKRAQTCVLTAAGFYTEGGGALGFPPPEIFQRITFFKLHYKGIITLEFLNCITKESLHYKGILRLFCLNITTCKYMYM